MEESKTVQDLHDFYRNMAEEVKVLLDTKPLIGITVNEALLDSLSKKGTIPMKQTPLGMCSTVIPLYLIKKQKAPIKLWRAEVEMNQYLMKVNNCE
jgi:hypothetical protein